MYNTERIATHSDTNIYIYVHRSVCVFPTITVDDDGSSSPLGGGRDLVLAGRGGLFQGGLEVADVLDDPLDELELGQLALTWHVGHEGAQLAQVRGDLLGLEVPPRYGDGDAVVVPRRRRGHSATSQGAHDHCLHD